MEYKIEIPDGMKPKIEGQVIHFEKNVDPYVVKFSIGSWWVDKRDSTRTAKIALHRFCNNELYYVILDLYGYEGVRKTYDISTFDSIFLPIPPRPDHNKFVSYELTGEVKVPSKDDKYYSYPDTYYAETGVLFPGTESDKRCFEGRRWIVKDIPEPEPKGLELLRLFVPGDRFAIGEHEMAVIGNWYGKPPCILSIADHYRRLSFGGESWRFEQLIDRKVESITRADITVRYLMPDSRFWKENENAK